MEYYCPKCGEKLTYRRLRRNYYCPNCDHVFTPPSEKDIEKWYKLTQRLVDSKQLTIWGNNYIKFDKP